MPDTQIGAGHLHRPQGAIYPSSPCLGQTPWSSAPTLVTWRHLSFLFFPSEGYLIAMQCWQVPCSLRLEQAQTDLQLHFAGSNPSICSENSLPCCKKRFVNEITPGFGFYGYYCTKENSNCIIYLFISY